MPVSEAKKKANARWNASKDNIMLRPTKEEGAAIRAAAAIAGQSNQQYILQATRERMERDIDRTAPKIAQNGPESTAGAGVVSLPSDALEATQGAAGPATGGFPDKAEAAKSLFGIMGNLGAVDLDESRGERLGIVYLSPDTLEAAQQAAEAAGEGLPDFVARAVETQAQRDEIRRKMKGGKANE